MFDDPISISRLLGLHPKLRDEAHSIVTNLWADGIPLRVTEGYRTWKQSDLDYAKGRTAPGVKITNAPGGSSYHNFGLALDFCLLDSKGAVFSQTIDLNHDSIADWLEVVKAFKNAGWVWGGDWHTIKDGPHVEKSFGYSVKQLKLMSKSGTIQYPEL